MQTRRREVNGLTIEEPLLDAEGQAKQRKLNELAMQEYTETHHLSGDKLREEVAAYEADIRKHVIE